MKDYLSKYLSMRADNLTANTKDDDLTKLTKLDPVLDEDSSVSFVSDQPLEYSGIDDEVAWRVQAMLPQIEVNRPIPFLVAREAVEPQAGCCLSCGEPLESDDRNRCTLCCRAANLALELAMSSKGGDGQNEESEKRC
jgi:hypothetical protein